MRSSWLLKSCQRRASRSPLQRGVTDSALTFTATTRCEQHGDSALRLFMLYSDPVQAGAELVSAGYPCVWCRDSPPLSL